MVTPNRRNDFNKRVTAAGNDADGEREHRRVPPIYAEGGVGGGASIPATTTTNSLSPIQRDLRPIEYYPGSYVRLYHESAGIEWPVSRLQLIHPRVASFLETVLDYVFNFMWCLIPYTLVYAGPEGFFGLEIMHAFAVPSVTVRRSHGSGCLVSARRVAHISDLLSLGRHLRNVVFTIDGNVVFLSEQMPVHQKICFELLHAVWRFRFHQDRVSRLYRIGSDEFRFELNYWHEHYRRRFYRTFRKLSKMDAELRRRWLESLKHIKTQTIEVSPAPKEIVRPQANWDKIAHKFWLGRQPLVGPAYAKRLKQVGFIRNADDHWRFLNFKAVGKDMPFRAKVAGFWRYVYIGTVSSDEYQYWAMAQARASSSPSGQCRVFGWNFGPAPGFSKCGDYWMCQRDENPKTLTRKVSAAGLRRGMGKPRSLKASQVRFYAEQHGVPMSQARYEMLGRRDTVPYMVVGSVEGKRTKQEKRQEMQKTGKAYNDGPLDQHNVRKTKSGYVIDLQTAGVISWIDLPMVSDVEFTKVLYKQTTKFSSEITGMFSDMATEGYYNTDLNQWQKDPCTTNINVFSDIVNHLIKMRRCACVEPRPKFWEKDAYNEGCNGFVRTSFWGFREKKTPDFPYPVASVKVFLLRTAEKRFIKLLDYLGPLPTSSMLEAQKQGLNPNIVLTPIYADAPDAKKIAKATGAPVIDRKGKLISGPKIVDLYTSSVKSSSQQSSSDDDSTSAGSSSDSESDTDSSSSSSTSSKSSGSTDSNTTGGSSSSSSSSSDSGATSSSSSSSTASTSTTGVKSKQMLKLKKNRVQTVAKMFKQLGQSAQPAMTSTQNEAALKAADQLGDLLTRAAQAEKESYDRLTEEKRPLNNFYYVSPGLYPDPNRIYIGRRLPYGVALKPSHVYYVSNAYIVMVNDPREWQCKGVAPRHFYVARYNFRCGTATETVDIPLDLICNWLRRYNTPGSYQLYYDYALKELNKQTSQIGISSLERSDLVAAILAAHSPTGKLSKSNYLRISAKFGPLAPGDYLQPPSLSLTTSATILQDFLHAVQAKDIKIALRLQEPMKPPLVRAAPIKCDHPLFIAPRDAVSQAAGVLKRLVPAIPEWTDEAAGRVVESVKYWLEKIVAAKKTYLAAANIRDVARKHCKTKQFTVDMTDDFMAGVESAIRGEKLDPKMATIYDCFTKFELYPEAKLPRSIQAPVCFVRGWTYATFYNASKTFEKVWDTHHVKHLSAQQKEQLYKGLAKNFGSWHSTDYSSFESCIGPFLTLCEGVLMYHMVPEDARPLVSDYYYQKLTYGMTFRHPNFTVSRPACRASGEYVTSIGNAIINSVLIMAMIRWNDPRERDQLVFLVEGDDAVFSTDHKIDNAGFGVKIKNVSKEGFFSHCSRVFQAVEAEEIADPVTVLSKVCWLLGPPPDTTHQDEELQAMKALSALLNHPNVPIISKVCREIAVQLNPNMENIIARLAKEQSWRGITADDFRRDLANLDLYTNVSEQSYQLHDQYYDLPAGTFKQWENELLANVADHALCLRQPLEDAIEVYANHDVRDKWGYYSDEVSSLSYPGLFVKTIKLGIIPAIIIWIATWWLRCGVVLAIVYGAHCVLVGSLLITPWMMDTMKSEDGYVDWKATIQSWRYTARLHTKHTFLWVFKGLMPAILLTLLCVTVPAPKVSLHERSHLQCLRNPSTCRNPLDLVLASVLGEVAADQRVYNRHKKDIRDKVHFYSSAYGVQDQTTAHERHLTRVWDQEDADYWEKVKQSLSDHYVSVRDYLKDAHDACYMEPIEWPSIQLPEWDRCYVNQSWLNETYHDLRDEVNICLERLSNSSSQVVTKAVNATGAAKEALSKMGAEVVGVVNDGKAALDASWQTIVSQEKWILERTPEPPDLSKTYDDVKRLVWNAGFDIKEWYVNRRLEDGARVVKIEAHAGANYTQLVDRIVEYFTNSTLSRVAERCTSVVQGTSWENADAWRRQMIEYCNDLATGSQRQVVKLEGMVDDLRSSLIRRLKVMYYDGLDLVYNRDQPYDPVVYEGNLGADGVRVPGHERIYPLNPYIGLFAMAQPEH